MAFVKVVCCIIAFVIGLALMQGVDFIVDFIKQKRGADNENNKNGGN